MSERSQKIIATLSTAARKTGTAAKGAAITTGSVLAYAWHDALEKDRQKFKAPQRPPQAPANTNSAPQSAPPSAQTAPPQPQITPFQQTLFLMSHAYNVADNDAHLIDALKGAKPVRFPTAEIPVLSVDVEGTLFDLTPREIHTNAEELSKAQATRMIRFAAANPSMRKNGITIDGSDATRKLLEELAAEAGLKILNPLTPPAPAQPVVTEPVVTEPVVTEPVATEPVVTEPAVTEPVIAQPVVTAPDVVPPTTTEAPADKIADEPLPSAAPAPAPISERVAKIINGSVSHEKYNEARAFLAKVDKINPHKLQVELGITRTQAKIILSGLAVEGLVKIDEINEDKKTLKTIYTVAANAAENVTVTETAAKPADSTPQKPAGPAPV